MKNFTLCFFFLLLLSLGASAQVAFTPVGWFAFGDQPDFNDNHYQWKDTAKVHMAAADWDWNLASVNWDALWTDAGTEYQMTHHAKDGDDLFDGGTSAGSSWKAFYDEDALYVMLKFVDKFAQFTDHGWEVAIQTYDPNRYEPDFTAAGTDVTLRNQSYARYVELGGKKIRFINPAVDQCNGSKGTAASWTDVGIALEELIAAPHYIDDQLATNGELRVILILEYTKVMAYLTEPTTGDVENIADYTAFDPAVKPVISFDVKSIGNVNAVESHYWWNAHQDEAYITTYYCGYMQFLPAEGPGSTRDVRQAEVRAMVVNNILRFTGTGNIDVDIYSITGQLVKSARNITEVNVADMNKGVYIAQIKGLSKAIKFVK